MRSLTRSEATALVLWVYKHERNDKKAAALIAKVHAFVQSWPRDLRGHTWAELAGMAEVA